MMTEKKRPVKSALRKVGKAIWSATPWVCMAVGLTCWLMLPMLYANERAELESQIEALETQNEMYESEAARLGDEIEWLRSLVEQELTDGQTQP